jgi:uncharacterized membrane protein YedE/YeeE
MTFLIDVFGWIGAAALLVAYWMVSTRRADGTAMSYQSLNLIGSVLVLVNSLYYGAYPSVAVNGVWIVIGAYAISMARK